MKLEKTTKRSETETSRKYHDACGTAFGLEMLGERWAIFIVRELMLGPRRFSDLRADLPGLSANVLTQRLTEMEERGIVKRETLPPPASVQVYGLTIWGYLAEPIVQEIGRWAARSPLHDPTLPISPVSIMLSLRTLVLRDRAKDVDMVVGFRFGALEFRAHVGLIDEPNEGRRGGIVITREPARDATIRFSGTAPGVAAFVHGGVPIEQLEAAGLLTAEGDPAEMARFRTLFSLPPKVVHECAQD